MRGERAYVGSPVNENRQEMGVVGLHGGYNVISQAVEDGGKGRLIQGESDRQPRTDQIGTFGDDAHDDLSGAVHFAPY